MTNLNIYFPNGTNLDSKRTGKIYVFKRSFRTRSIKNFKQDECENIFVIFTLKIMPTETLKEERANVKLSLIKKIIPDVHFILS